MQQPKAGMAPDTPQVSENLVTFSFCVFVYLLWKFKQRKKEENAKEEKVEVVVQPPQQPQQHFTLTDCFGDVITPHLYSGIMMYQDDAPARSSTPFSVESDVSERDKWEVVAETTPFLPESAFDSDVE